MGQQFEVAQPYAREAHVQLRNGNFRPELPKPGQTHQTAMVEDGKIYHGIETYTANVGSSIPHLIGLTETSKLTGTPVHFESVYVEVEGGTVYHLQARPSEQAWTITTSDHPEVAHKLDIQATDPFVVGHEFIYAHQGEQRSLKTKKVKRVVVLDKSHGADMPKLGTGNVEDNTQLIHQVHHVKIDPHSPDPEHVQRTIKVADDEDGVTYVAGYRQHERHEGLHMHASRNELEVLEGYFEVCIFDRATWTWGEHRIYGPGSTFRLKPNTPHLVTPAQQPLHPHRLSVIKITTDRAANIDPGQGYNIPLPKEIPTELPPLDHHGFLRRLV